MKTIKQILDAKGREVWFVTPSQSVFEAITLMAEKRIGALLVMDGQRMVGIISERDYARNVILKGRSSKGTPVQEIMTANVVCARPDQTIEEGMALMTEKRIRHLPILVDNRVEGLVSIGDLVKAIISEQQFMIAQLEHYITT